MKTRILIIIILAALQIAGTAQTKKADCANLFLDTVSFDIMVKQDTVVSGFLHYMDNSFAVYPVLHLILPDTTHFTSPDVMVLSLLQYGSREHFKFRLRVKQPEVQTTEVINALFHIYDSDMPGDSIVTCYLPITLNLQKSTGLNTHLATLETRLFPNPAGTSATLEISENTGQNFNLSLYDLKGSAIREYKNVSGGTLQIEKQELANGMYFYNVTTTEGYDIIRGKIIFQ